ncbi:MAG: hypothetical protein PHN56_00855 [Candidatus Nanoarchaeia archaeon]|nr:hypothetical protein [Candidatus Nanoarchaeia archaeon]
MNEQFSMLYTLIFLCAILGSFAALKVSIDYWANYEIFLMNSNELTSAFELSNYFDSYSVSLNFSKNLTIFANSSIIEFTQGNYYKQYSNSANINNIKITGKDFTIKKTIGGLALI